MERSYPYALPKFGSARSEEGELPLCPSPRRSIAAPGAAGGGGGGHFRPLAQGDERGARGPAGDLVIHERGGIVLADDTAETGLLVGGQELGLPDRLVGV